MKGATEYYRLFNGKSQQIGRLYLNFSTHARGECFEMYVTPKDKTYKDCSRKELVLVYGMTGGQRGWTESYGWLATGKWQDDFSQILEKQHKIKKKANKEAALKKEQSLKDKAEHKQNLLSDYQ